MIPFRLEVRRTQTVREKNFDLLSEEQGAVKERADLIMYSRDRE